MSLSLSVLPPSAPSRIVNTFITRRDRWCSQYEMVKYTWPPGQTNSQAIYIWGGEPFPLGGAFFGESKESCLTSGAV